MSNRTLSGELNSSESLPSAGGLPLLGAIPQLVRHRLDFLVRTRERCGDVFTIDLGPSRIVALCHPDHAQHVLRDHARNYTKASPLWDAIRGLIGNGLPASEGEFWRRQRRMIQPHFHRERLAAMASLMVDAIDETMADWDARLVEGAAFDIGRELTRMTMKVIVRTMFGGQIRAEEADEVGREMGFALDYMLTGLVTRKLPRWAPIPGRRRFLAAVESLDAILRRVIASHKDGDGRAGDFVSMMLGMVDAETGERMTMQELRDEAMSMFLAGYETTAAGLSFALHALVERPALLGELEAEVRAAVGERRPGFADLPHLPLARAIFQESLRLHPVAYWMSRTAIADDVIGGHRIAAGAEIGVMTYVIQRHPDFWQDPERFDPGRFLGDAGAERHPLAWMPFGAGQRICIGKEFALMEAQLILARLLGRYRVSPAPGHRFGIHIGTTLRPSRGVWVRLARRRGLA